MTNETPEQPTRPGSAPGAPDHHPEPLGSDAVLSQHLDVDALSAYLDQQLPPADLAAARAHLAACPDCGQELAELRATVALLRSLPQFSARRDFQLGPEHARRTAAGRIPGAGSSRAWQPSGIDRWFDRLIPAFPAVRIATAVVAVLLVAVIAGDLIVNRGAGNVAMLPASSRVEVGRAPEAAMPRQAPAAQDGGQRPAAVQPTMVTTDDAEAFAEPAAEVGTDAAAPASMEEDGAAGDAPGIVASDPAAEPAPAAPSPSGWRLAQVGLGLALLWLIVSLVGIARLRRDRFSAPAGEPNRGHRR